jgi:hypothetical protein
MPDFISPQDFLSAEGGGRTKIPAPYKAKIVEQSNHFY